MSRFYEQLAVNKDIEWLMYLAQYDERVYDVVDKHQLTPLAIAALPSPQAAMFLAKGMVYEPIHTEVMQNFIRICMHLSRFSTVEEAVALGELVSSCGLPEQYRAQLFNFSETYRHMILSNSYFVQRSVLKLLAYVFCDDVLSDAVAQLQYKSDILNHVNRVFTTSPDFISWRYSVRVMSIAGGYNEDRSDVEYTDALVRVVTRVLPEFLTYFSITFCYAMVRFYPKRVRGITPRWLARHRALFSATYCSIMGILVNTVADYRAHQHRVQYELRRSQELRRRRGAERRGLDYDANPYFDNLEGVTRRVFGIQCQSYLVAGTMLGVSLLPLTKVTFPKWMGDVTWRHPFLPRLFPSLMGLHAASRCVVPFVFAPFTMTTLLCSNQNGVTLYDYYVNMRFVLWHRKTEVAFDTSAEVSVDLTEKRQRD